MRAQLAALSCGLTQGSHHLRIVFASKAKAPRLRLRECLAKYAIKSRTASWHLPSNDYELDNSFV
jgi:hypothetical protein